MRELHWHPNADEWQYYISGHGRTAVFASGAHVRLPGRRRRLHPLAMGHHVEARRDAGVPGDVPQRPLRRHLHRPMDGPDAARTRRAHLNLDEPTIAALSRTSRSSFARTSPSYGGHQRLRPPRRIRARGLARRHSRSAAYRSPVVRSHRRDQLPRPGKSSRLMTGNGLPRLRDGGRGRTRRRARRRRHLRGRRLRRDRSSGRRGLRRVAATSR